MMVYRYWGIFFVCLAMLLAGCSGGSQSPLVTADLQSSAGEGPGSSYEAVNPAHSSSEFALEVLDESYIYDSSADAVSLKVEDLGDQVAVHVQLDGAVNMRALYYNLAYDRTRFTPTTVVPAKRFGQPDDMLTIAMLGESGKVYAGQVLIHPQDRQGFSGDGVLATVSFMKQPAPVGRFVSSPPVTNPSAAQLSRIADTENFHLKWGYTSQGDYDQNSECNQSDLTPIAVNFGEQGPFEYYSIEAIVDGDGNNEINISDITPIGANFNRRIERYLLYTDPSLDNYPASNGEASAVEPIASFNLGDFQGNRVLERLWTTYELTGQPLDQYYWVRPAEGTEVGTPSNALLHDKATVQPVISLVATPEEGNIPLDVAFDATLTESPLGEVADFEWDLDGDGNFNESDNGEDTFQGLREADYRYESEGVYPVTLRVTGPHGVIAELTVEIFAKDPPTAALTATPTTGDAPLSVNFDASGSTDNGEIVLYEWDLNYDGTFEVSTGSTPSVSDVYGEKGTHAISVRVTDNSGLTDTASVDITLATGFTFGTILTNILMDSKASLETFGTAPDEFPALAYKDAATDDLYFLRGLDGTAKNWGTPVAVQTSGQVGNDATLRNIEGIPGISFKRAQSKLDFIMANDTLGESWWANSLEVDGGGGAGAFTSLAVVNGKPAVASIAGGKDDLRFAIASNLDGLSWGSAFDVEASLSGGDEIEFTDLEIVNGFAGILFNFVGDSGTGLKFIRATNAGATSWGSSVIIDVPEGGGRYPALCMADGFPAASYEAFSVDELRFCRALDADGAVWGTPVTVDAGVGIGQYSSMCVAGGVPVIAYTDGGNLDQKFAVAGDAQGTSWLSFVVDSQGAVGLYTTMTVVNDIPVIAYYDATNTALKVAVFEN